MGLTMHNEEERARGTKDQGRARRGSEGLLSGRVVAMVLDVLGEDGEEAKPLRLRTKLMVGRSVGRSGRAVVLMLVPVRRCCCCGGVGWGRVRG